MLTNQKIFEQVINEHPLNAGILREALSKYVEMLENSDPWNDSGSIIRFETWSQLTKDLKNRIDELYSKNY